MSLLAALSTGLAQCTEHDIPESLTQLVATMNIELNSLGVFTLSRPLHLSTGVVYDITLKSEKIQFVKSFIQLNYYYSGWYSFAGKVVDMNYQSLYDVLAEWLENPQNILQLNLGMINLTNLNVTGETV